MSPKSYRFTEIQLTAKAALFFSVNSMALMAYFWLLCGIFLLKVPGTRRIVEYNHLILYSCQYKNSFS